MQGTHKLLWNWLVTRILRMTQPPKLDEKYFIHEDPKSPFSTSFLWVAIALAVIVLLWMGGSWFTEQVNLRVVHSPFLRVTNREMSLFLWQNPEHMRINAKRKTGYLPGFHSINRTTIKPEEANQYVSAPPVLLHQYHIWNRLVSDEWAERPIPTVEFRDFLVDAEAWLPENWPESPEAYKALVETLRSTTPPSLETLPISTLPVSVRKAFQGWRNYYREGEEINRTIPTYGELATFLREYPHYNRQYWKNIVGDQYLKSYHFGKMNDDTIISPEELAPFIRVAFFNWKKSLSSAE